MNRHPCLKAQVVCAIETWYDDSWITLAVGRNSCISQDGPDSCAREGLPGGTQYDLCGPPIHAEEDALRQFDVREWSPNDEYRAVITGQDWVCRDCQKLLFGAGIRTFIVEG